MNKSRDTDCLFFCFVALAFVFLAWCTLPVPSVQAEEQPTITIGVYENKPKIFTDAQGKPAGIFIDIIETIAKEEGWQLRYKSGSWGEGLDRLAKGEIDLMPDIAHTPERANFYAFPSVPVLSSWFQVYAPNNTRYQSILDLNGKRILVLDRSVQQEAFIRLSRGFGLDITLVPVPDYKTMFEKVAKGEADAAVTNRFYGMAHAKEYGLQDTAIVFEPSDLFFAAPRGDPKRLLPVIDRHVETLKKDPSSSYYKSIQTWTSEKVAFRLPMWLRIVGIGGVAFLTLSLTGSAILKYQVNNRTRELQLVNQEMEQRIIARTAELAAAMEQAKEADRIKSAFLATMSHELRTPLNSIIGFTGIILQGLAGPLNDEQQKQMGMVQNSARHLLSLINDVLDISKIEAGQLVLASDPFDLGASVDKMVKLVSPLAAKKGLSLHQDLPDSPVQITTDQRRFEQVVLNLLNNAIKFTETGSVSISCRCLEDHILLLFTDTGIGIPAAEIPTLFQPFHQLDSGLARKHEGTGLGLSICKKILDMMGGGIKVESEPGKGSTFIVHIPRQGGGDHE